MLYSAITPPEKRRRLRAALASGELLQFPGAFNPLSARLIERKGFDGVYISGAVLSAELGTVARALALAGLDRQVLLDAVRHAAGEA